jgi:hypothetical protein
MLKYNILNYYAQNMSKVAIPKATTPLALNTALSRKWADVVSCSSSQNWHMAHSQGNSVAISPFS